MYWIRPHSESYNAECFNGQLREEFVLEYCYYGEWRRICSRDSQWNIKKAMAACTRLGYSDSGKLLVINIMHDDWIMWCLILGITRIDEQCPLPRKAVILTDCNGPGLTNCTVIPRSNCEIHCVVVVLQQCNTGWSWLWVNYPFLFFTGNNYLNCSWLY